MQGDELVRSWRATIAGSGKSWAVFENGTCVVLSQPDPEADLAAQVVELLPEWGRVHAGSSSGDFGVIELEGGRGWVVTSHHNDVLTLVGPDEVGPDEVGPDAEDLAVGLLGRSKWGRDAEEFKVPRVSTVGPC